MGCGHKIVLSKNMSYGKTCFSGSYAFQDDMPFRMTCYDNVLREVLLCCRKCLMGGHVLMECMFSGWHILQYVVFY